MTITLFSMINLYTIGFTKKSAERFFDLLVSNGVTRIADTRLNNTSQLAGFAKADDLKYFAKKVGNIGYIHIPEFAPTDEILSGYRKKLISWDEYEKAYRELLISRNVREFFNPNDFNNNVLLCSEDTPDKCHRRILAEYLQTIWEGVRINHLV